MPRKLALIVGILLLSTASLYLAGCGGQPGSATTANSDNGKTPKSSPGEGEDDHAHKAGAHGGMIVPIGRDNYHAEAVFEKGGLLRLYMLGRDETRLQEVDKQTLLAFVKQESDSESTSVPLKPEPQQGDSEGRTSQFVGRLPEDLVGKSLAVTVPSITINGERFRLGFASATPGHDGDMPEGVSADEEGKLYLTPGGIYTEADIKANGSVTASQKFKGFKPKHDLKPKPGDKICPITLTKANPECTWIVGGKKYEFCCPPCVHEFVAMAKDPQTSQEIKAPDFYVKRESKPSNGAVKGTDNKQDEQAIQEALAELSPEDRRLVEAQGYCAILEENRLGSMGAPFKVMIKDRAVFLCCKGCRTKALADPDKTLTKVEGLKAKVKAGSPGK